MSLGTRKNRRGTTKKVVKGKLPVSRKQQPRKSDDRLALRGTTGTEVGVIRQKGQGTDAAWTDASLTICPIPDKAGRWSRRKEDTEEPLNPPGIVQGEANAKKYSGGLSVP